MSLEVCVLASGSAGNCTVVRTPGGTLLIDAGIGPRTAAQRLAGTGASVSEVSGICLTHLDHDHFNKNWLTSILNRGINVYCHESRVDDLVGVALGPRPSREELDRFVGRVLTFDRDLFEALPGLSVRPLRFAHDSEGSHGFVLEGFGCRVGYATDLGRVPHTLGEDFDDLDLLAIESNYDRQMQLDSPRPWFLKNRIMGGSGHLSNEQAFDAVRLILNQCESRGRAYPAHVVLLHRSRDCNCPERLRRLFSRDVRIAPRLVLAEQYERTEWLRPRREAPYVGGQLQLAWG
jgi:phosphoribosyl 1,2-cyclic phosphodiesterase